MNERDRESQLDAEFERQVAVLDAMQKQPIPTPANPVVLVANAEVRGWFASFAEAAQFARASFEPGRYAIRNLADPVPYVPMVAIKN